MQVTAHWQSTAEMAVQASSYGWKVALSPIIAKTLQAFAAFIAAICVFSIYTSGPVTANVVLLILSVCGLTLPWQARSFRRKVFSRSPGANADITCRLTDEGVETTVGTLISSKFSWSVVNKTVHTPVGFLLYSNDESILWIPFKGLATDEDLIIARRIINDHVQIHKSVT